MNVPNITIVRESPEKRARSPIDEATRRKRCRVSEAVAVLAPRFQTGEDVHAVEWSTGTPRIAGQYHLPIRNLAQHKEGRSD